MDTPTGLSGLVIRGPIRVWAMCLLTANSSQMSKALRRRQPSPCGPRGLISHRGARRQPVQLNFNAFQPCSPPGPSGNRWQEKSRSIGTRGGAGAPKVFPEEDPFRETRVHTLPYDTVGQNDAFLG
jgi:hypothetical protein